MSFWIENELRNLYPQLPTTLWRAGSAGIDLDGNGTINTSESFGDLQDSDRDGYIDAGEWERYLSRNQTLLAQRPNSLFRAAIASPSAIRDIGAFDADNPLHELMRLALPYRSSHDIAQVYHEIKQLVEAARVRLSSGQSPEQKMEVLFAVLREAGFQYEEGSDFVSGFLGKKFDCDLSSILLACMGVELGLPLSLVRAPNHAFVRWDLGESHINFDFTITEELHLPATPLPDLFYQNAFFISDEAIRGHIYLTPLTRQQLISLFYISHIDSQSSNPDYLNSPTYEEHIRYVLQNDVPSAEVYNLYGFYLYRQRSSGSINVINMENQLHEMRRHLLAINPYDARILLYEAEYQTMNMLRARDRSAFNTHSEQALQALNEAIRIMEEASQRGGMGITYRIQGEEQTSYQSTLFWSHPFLGVNLLIQAYQARSLVYNFLGRQNDRAEDEGRVRDFILTQAHASRLHFLEDLAFSSTPSRSRSPNSGLRPPAWRLRFPYR